MALLESDLNELSQTFIKTLHGECSGKLFKPARQRWLADGFRLGGGGEVKKTESGNTEQESWNADGTCYLGAVGYPIWF